MKIYDFSPFNNENMICQVKSGENSAWVDETHIIEFNRTFQNQKKEFNFNTEESKKLIAHKVLAEELFISDSLTFKIKRKFRSLSGIKSVDFGFGYVVGNAWINEATQRNYSNNIINQLNIDDEDILIFSDVDEIIYSDYKDIVIENVKKYGIITIKLENLTYYFNLRLNNIGGADHYSYRVFIMTGERYKKLNISIDMLRKAGEKGRLEGLVYCPNEVLGVHYSSVGNADFIVKKLNSFAHTEMRKYADINYINTLISSKKTIFEGTSCEVDNEMKQLRYVEDNKNFYREFFL